MFEELDLKIADITGADKPHVSSLAGCTTFKYYCSQSSCAGTSGKYCC